jgi:hypothetical protein
MTFPEAQTFREGFRTIVAVTTQERRNQWEGFLSCTPLGRIVETPRWDVCTLAVLGWD